jgi:hypothetical protein
MKTEEIIILVFVGVITIGIPIILWGIHRDNKRREEEEWNRGKTKRK